jgi:hypothetical protein
LRSTQLVLKWRKHACERARGGEDKEGDATVPAQAMNEAEVRHVYVLVRS